MNIRHKAKWMWMLCIVEDDGIQCSHCVAHTVWQPEKRANDKLIFKAGENDCLCQYEQLYIKLI